MWTRTILAGSSGHTVQAPQPSGTGRQWRFITLFFNEDIRRTTWGDPISGPPNLGHCRASLQIWFCRMLPFGGLEAQPVGGMRCSCWGAQVYRTAGVVSKFPKLGLPLKTVVLIRSRKGWAPKIHCDIPQYELKRGFWVLWGSSCLRRRPKMSETM